MRSCSSGIPIASFNAPPYLLIVATKSCGTLLEPCSTIGNPGIRFSTSSRISKRKGGGTRMPSAFRVHCSGLNLLAPCEVPMEIASESTPVCFTKSSTSSGCVYVWCSACTSSSIPARTPSSPSTVTSYLCAYSTTFLVSSIFSAYGRCEPSIITDEKPYSMQLWQSSKLSPWSKCNTIGTATPNSLAYSTAPCAIYRSKVWFA